MYPLEDLVGQRAEEKLTRAGSSTLDDVETWAVEDLVGQRAEEKLTRAGSATSR
jgi:hypothetical protein